MRVLFALPGLHRIERGAEIAFLALAEEMARVGDAVTVIGSGAAGESRFYRFIHAGSVRRERFERLPQLPVFRNETAYEEASFVPALLARYRPADYDVTFTCSYPFTNWVLRRPTRPRRPPHIFITQNGDWPAQANGSEYRFFGCEGLVCTNPDYYDRNKAKWRSTLIPNGIKLGRFGPGSPERSRFGIPERARVVLMVSALSPSKRVLDGIRAVSRVEDAHLVCAGDGPLRGEVEAAARDLLPGRFTRLTVRSTDMPILYRCADAFLHLSKDEAFGNVYVEALATGLPIVAHDMARVRWIVGDDEFLVDTDDLAEVGEAVSAALGSQPARIDARVARAAAFDWANIASRYRAFAESVVRDWTDRV